MDWLNWLNERRLCFFASLNEVQHSHPDAVSIIVPVAVIVVIIATVLACIYCCKRRNQGSKERPFDTIPEDNQAPRDPAPQSPPSPKSSPAPQSSQAPQPSSAPQLSSAPSPASPPPEPMASPPRMRTRSQTRNQTPRVDSNRVQERGIEMDRLQTRRNEAAPVPAPKTSRSRSLGRVRVAPIPLVQAWPENAPGPSSEQERVEEMLARIGQGQSLSPPKEKKNKKKKTCD